MHTVTYQLSTEDVLALSRDRMTWSRRWRRAHLVRAIMWYVIAACAAFLFLKNSDSTYRLVTSLAIGFAGPGLYIPLLPLRKHVYMTAIRDSFAEGKNLTLLGEHRMSLHEGYFEGESPMTMSRIRWDAVERISDAPQHILIYISAMSAYIIPKRAFASPQEATAFLETARNFWQASRSRAVDLTAPPPWAT